MFRKALHHLRRALGHLGLRGRTIEEWERWHEAVVRRAVDRVVPHLPEGGLFVDVGANIGTFARLLLDERPDVRGILFEPVEAYHRRCAARFADDPRIEVHRLAIGDEDAERVIYKAAHNYGANSLVQEIMHDRRPNSMVSEETVIEEETVRVRHFGRWLDERGLDHVDVVKSDTEGYDYAVLLGLVPWMRRTGCRPVINVEMLEEDYHTRPDRQREALEACYALGYGEVDLARLDWIVADVLLLPEERAATP